MILNRLDRQSPLTCQAITVFFQVQNYILFEYDGNFSRKRTLFLFTHHLTSNISLLTFFLVLPRSRENRRVDLQHNPAPVQSALLADTLENLHRFGAAHIGIPS